GKQFVIVPIDLSRFARGAQVEFGLYDQQILLVIDGKTVICNAYDHRSAVEDEPLHRLAIGSISANLQIDDLKVWRDIYYLDPRGLSRDWQAERPLGANEYALLGDNQPVSVDSRIWLLAGVLRTAIRGLVRKK